MDHPFVLPDSYAFFQPYIIDYARNGENFPLNTAGQPWGPGDGLRVTRSTFLRDHQAPNARIASESSKIQSMDLAAEDLEGLVFLDANGMENARVVQVRITHPRDLDLTDAEFARFGGRLVCAVTSTAVTPRGVAMTVTTMLAESNLDLVSPAAIISERSLDFAGQVRVRWGEAWAQDDVFLPANWTSTIWPQTDTSENGYWAHNSGNSGNDPWFRLRTEGFIRSAQGDFADGRDRRGFLPAAPTPADGMVYTVPFDNGSLYRDRQGRATHEGYENLLQNQTLDFPSYNYDDWREFFIRNDLPYFFTDTDGRIFGRDRDPDSDTFGQIIGGDYAFWFDIDPSDPMYNDFESRLAFIDSVPVDNAGNPGPRVDGVPVVNATYFPRNPDAPNARLAEIRIAGGSIHTRGAKLIAANLNMTGQGNPPRHDTILNDDGTRQVLMPNGQVPPQQEDFRIFHNGLMYSWGEVRGGGNRTIYGSIYAERGYGSGGSPSVYYNVRLRDGSFLEVNQSRVRRTLWDIAERPADALDGAEQ